MTLDLLHETIRSLIDTVNTDTYFMWSKLWDDFYAQVTVFSPRCLYLLKWVINIVYYNKFVKYIISYYKTCKYLPQIYRLYTNMCNATVWSNTTFSYKVKGLPKSWGKQMWCAMPQQMLQSYNCLVACVYH